ncbi:MAG TPA: M14 family zinc carboxypeptidase [Burkholderiales bacterium]|nr:M14 family zinc carboxypeptidase [Burkholderiales bacterium]
MHGSSQSRARDEFPELLKLERIIEEGGAHLQVRKVCEVATDRRHFPVYALCLGNPSPEVPGVGFFGGIHGLERIGTQVLLSYLHSLLGRLRWDHLLQRYLESVRLVFMPLVNPGGMWRGTRSNPRGVDLMRNAPVESAHKVPFLYGGQRISARLPWYRGSAEQQMEIEGQAVCSVVQEELFGREFSLALDCHSGFGQRDRIWFPYAHSAEPIPHLPEIDALHGLFDETYPHHNYLFEPQCRQYLAHGDLWDHLYALSLQRDQSVFLPLTLEMGSWLWVKKSPRQLFSRLGIFNPLPVHRLQRVLRSHLLWMDFLVRAAASHRNWLPASAARARHRQAAIERWY